MPRSRDKIAAACRGVARSLVFLAKVDGHPEPDLVATSSGVIAGKMDVAALQRFAVWKDTPAATPESKS